MFIAFLWRPVTPFPPLYQEQDVNILCVCVFYNSSDFKFKFQDGSEKFDLFKTDSWEFIVYSALFQLYRDRLSLLHCQRLMNLWR